MRRHLGLLLLTTTALGAAPAAAGAPRLIHLAGPVETDVRAVSLPGNPIRWIPEAVFLVEFDAWSQEDVVLVDWQSGGKSLGKPFACVADQYIKEVQDNPTTPLVPVHLARFRCRFPDDAGITKAGGFRLALTYKQTLAGKSHELGALTMDVIEIAQGSQNKPTRTFADDRDHQLGLATIEEYTGGSSRDGADLIAAAEKHVRLRPDANHELVIRFWTKFDDKGPRTMTMACLLGDTKVGEAQNVTGGVTASYWTFAGKERKNVHYVQQGFRFYKMLSGKRKVDNPQQFFIGDNPGDYRCVAMAGGEVIDEVRFTVGADGEIAKTACDDQITRLAHVHVVPSSNAAIANLPWDKKPAQKGGMFGHVTWKAGCPAR